MEQKEKKVQKQNIFFSKGKMDITFFVLVLIILTIGLVMLFSASAPYALSNDGNSYHYISRQAVFAVVGLIAMYVISRIDYHVLRKFAWILYVISAVMLLAVLIMPPLYEGYAFKRWIVLGPLQFQPSEIAKFAVVILFAHLISKNYKRMEEFKYGILFFGLLLGLICGLVVVEPHLSATLLIFSLGIVMMIVGGIKARYIALGGGGAIGILLIAILSGVVSYGSDRIQHWLNPWLDATGKGYQTIQSLLAIGSGGIMGRGIGESRQKYLWVPEPQNDFIFSIVCEELGLVGAFIIIVLFALLVWRGFIIAMRAPDKFGALISIGLTFQVGMQTVLNMMVVTNTIPNTGISLPFFSYGGTALLMLLAQMGVVLSISRSSTVEKT